MAKVPGNIEVPIADYPKPSGTGIPTDAVQVREICETFVEKLNAVLTGDDFSQLNGLMLKNKNSWWRDYLMLSWDLRTFNGAQDAITALENRADGSGFKNISIEGAPIVSAIDPAATVPCIQSYLTVETEAGRGRGIIRLVHDVDDGDKWKIYTLYTSLRELKGYEEFVNSRRPKFDKPASAPNKQNWKEYREDQQNFDEKFPVLIIGAGISGLMVAARLGALGVRTLIIEKNSQVGDSWRRRYHNLILHDTARMDEMPYLPYPPTWPVFPSKDKFADWLQSYASVLDLNVWCKTKIIFTLRNEEEKSWTVIVEREVDGKTSQVILNPRHLILATGLYGMPRIPTNIDGINEFMPGRIFHSSAVSGFTDQYAGKRVIVVGTGNTAQDIALGCEEHGAHVTIIQRGSTNIVSRETVALALSQRFGEHGVSPAAHPLPVAKHILSDVTKLMFEKMDAALLGKFEKAGFKYNRGPNGGGFAFAAMEQGGGFLLDTGLGDALEDGKITVKQGQEIVRVGSNIVTFTDGSTLPADEIIFATGYESPQSSIENTLGSALADKVGPVIGINDKFEFSGKWCQTAQSGLWVAAGNLMWGRYYSRLLALQIKAIEEGIWNP